MKPWLVILTALLAWIPGGVWVYYHPRPVSAEAVIQVPPGTDPETICARPDVLEETRAILALEQGASESATEFDVSIDGPPDLAGKLTAQKKADGTWSLWYSASSKRLAIGEMSALITALEKQVTRPSHQKVAGERSRLQNQIRELNEKMNSLHGTEEEILPASYETLADSDGEVKTVSGMENPSLMESDREQESESSAIQERMKTLQKSLMQTQSVRRQTEEEAHLVGRGLRGGRKLEAIANQLTAGPVQDAVRQIDRQARLSAELQQLNSQLTSDSEIYGEKHPRLVELRRRFERLLQEVGGWEQLITDSAVPEQLQATLEQLCKSRAEEEDDLQLQLDLQASELKELNRVSQLKSAETQLVQKIRTDLELAKRELTQLDRPLSGSFTLLKAPSINAQLTMWEKSWPWIIVLTSGLLFGWAASHIRRSESTQEYPVFEEITLLTVPRILFEPVDSTPSQIAATENRTHDGDVGNAGLAQRRAARQSRWQQTYA